MLLGPFTPYAARGAVTIGVAVGLVKIGEVIIHENCPLKPTTQVTAMLVSMIVTTLFYALAGNLTPLQASFVGFGVSTLSKMVTISKMVDHRSDGTIPNQMVVACIADISAVSIVSLGIILAEALL